MVGAMLISLNNILAYVFLSHKPFSFSVQVDITRDELSPASRSHIQSKSSWLLSVTVVPLLKGRHVLPKRSIFQFVGGHSCVKQLTPFPSQQPAPLSTMNASDEGTSFQFSPSLVSLYFVFKAYDAFSNRVLVCSGGGRVRTLGLLGHPSVN